MNRLSSIPDTDDKDQLYLAVRAKEGRIYTDAELLVLPDIYKGHRYYAEWMYRKRSFFRFTEYLSKGFENKKLNILDIGCGNGWMSHRLNIEGHSVTGVDTNVTELVQASAVFGNSATLKWINGDIFNEGFDGMQFDVVVLAAACQYFPDIEKLTDRLRDLLHKGGEIHLIDSRFYDDSELKNARQRSVDYYFSIGFPQMSLHYHHHAKATLKSLGYKKVYPSLVQQFNSNPQLGWWVLKC